MSAQGGALGGGGGVRKDVVSPFNGEHSQELVPAKSINQQLFQEGFRNRALQSSLDQQILDFIFTVYSRGRQDGYEA